MRKKLYLFLILFIISFLKITAQDKSDVIKNIIPPSPQAFEMVKYGNMPLNEYQGMAQINIPIAEVRDHNISTNITLNYANLGVKVADVPTAVGMSWLLQMGGVITRKVYDLPDEYNSSTRILFNENDITNVKNVLDKTAEAELLNSYHLNPFYDNEIDIFQFSVNGLSGKFYLDHNLKPILLSRNNLVTIETIGDFKTTHQLLITDVDGVEYYFGGEGAIERTFIKTHTDITNNVTSFYLTKIKDTTNNEIIFNYSVLVNTTSSHWLGKQELLPVKEDSYIEETANDVGIKDVETLAAISYTSEEQLLMVKNPVELSSIVSTGKTVRINYNKVTNSSFRSVSSIDISNTLTGKLTQSIDFKYIYHQINSNTIRFYLENIKRYNYYNEEKIFDNEHSFTYDNPLDLPDNKSFSVDVYGYYNGRSSNSNFLPDLKKLYKDDEDLKYDYSSLPTYNYADRNSDFEYSKKGTLKTITYPTKGTTHFEYEGIDTREKIIEYGSLNVNHNNYNSQEYASVFLNGSDIIGNVIEGRILITQSNIIVGAPNIKVTIQLFNATTNQLVDSEELVYLRADDLDAQAGWREKFKDFKFIVQPNISYKLLLSLTKKDNVDYMGTVNYSYNGGYRKANIVGLRLKRMYDKDENGKLFNIKRLFYSTYKGINANPLLNDPYPDGFLNDEYRAAMGDPRDAPPTGSMEKLIVARQYKILSSNSSSASSWDNYYTKFNFPNVTVSYGGDNFEKGGEEKLFNTGGYKDSKIVRSPVDVLHFFYGSSLMNLTETLRKRYDRAFVFDDFNGKPLMTRVIGNKGSNHLVCLKKSIYNYNYNIVSSLYNLNITPAYQIAIYRYGYTPTNTVFNLFATYSPLSSYITSPLGSVETLYLDDVPVDTEDDSSYSKLTTTTNYVYGNPIHNQITNQKITFPDSSYQTTDYSYASEKGNTYLTGKNMIGIPLVTETKKTANGITKIISKTETVYPVDQTDANGSTLGLPLPKSVSVIDLIAGGMSTEVTYDQYDIYGNLLQYTTKDGIPVMIIWGYNQTQPIAKIVGSSYPQPDLRTTNISQSIVRDLMLASNADALLAPGSDEYVFLEALDTFRKDPLMAGYQITTYTYDPLIGVRSITPPNGIRQIYIYDTANRLKEVREQSQTGNILKEYQYHYRP